MTRLHRMILLQEYDKLKPRTAAPARRLTTPPHLVYFGRFSEVRIDFFIREVDGSPTSWKLHPRLEEGIITTSGYQDTNPVFRTLTRDEAAARTVLGEWLPDLTQADAALFPYLWSVTILHPAPLMRINWGEYYAAPGVGVSPTDISLNNAAHPDAFTMTGGTDPGIQAACVAYGKVN